MGHVILNSHSWVLRHKPARHCDAEGPMFYRCYFL